MDRKRFLIDLEQAEERLFKGCRSFEIMEENYLIYSHCFSNFHDITALTKLNGGDGLVISGSDGSLSIYDLPAGNICAQRPAYKFHWLESIDENTFVGQGLGKLGCQLFDIRCFQRAQVKA